MKPQGIKPKPKSFDPHTAITNLRRLTNGITGDPIILGLPARFWTKIALPGTATDCWLWTARLDRGGYGQFHLGPKCFRAHRLTYEALVGEIPEGLQLDHGCRIRSCVNPSHLEPVTQRENVLRGTAPAALHARKTRCPKGHPYNEANTYRYPNGRRDCRVCRAERRNTHIARKAAI